jgi:hypothetical protein
MSISAQSRVRVLDNPILAPGQCCLCGSAGDGKRKFIDFGKQLDWYGAVYFCTECVREVAEASGFIPVASFDKLHDSYRELDIKYKQLEARYEVVDNAIRTVFGGNYSVASSPDESFHALLSNVQESDDSEGSVGETEPTDARADVRESETDESTDVEGPDDIFDASDFE